MPYHSCFGEILKGILQTIKGRCYEIDFEKSNLRKMFRSWKAKYNGLGLLKITV